MTQQVQIGDKTVEFDDDVLIAKILPVYFNYDDDASDTCRFCGNEFHDGQRIFAWGEPLGRTALEVLTASHLAINTLCSEACVQGRIKQFVDTVHIDVAIAWLGR